MNKSDAHLYMPLVQALAEGKTIQRNMAFPDGDEWQDQPELWIVGSWMQYRIKPDKRTAYVWFPPRDYEWQPMAYQDRATAEHRVKVAGGHIVEVVE